MESNAAVVVSVNVGQPRTVEWRGRRSRPPSGSSGRRRGDGRRVNVDGDDQADRRVQETDKPCYLYSSEDYPGGRTGRCAHPGTFGENLTTSGIDFRYGTHRRSMAVGTGVVEVAQPRQPCLQAWHPEKTTFSDRFAVAQRPGIYLRIVEAGTIAAGDTIEVEPTELPAISIVSLVEDNDDVGFLRQVAADPRVPDGWRRAARRALRP